jgi:hypothetical protein
MNTLIIENEPLRAHRFHHSSDTAIVITTLIILVEHFFKDNNVAES